MFDTIAIRCSIPAICQKHLSTIDWERTGTSLQHNGIKEHISTFKTIRRKKTKSSMPYIRYSLSDKDPAKAFIKVEVSIPKFLYGNNVDEITEADVASFYKKLRRYVAKQLHMSTKDIPPIRQWKVIKLHVCKNFNVGKHVQAYLKSYSQLSRPKYKQQAYFERGGPQVETVEWRARTRKEKVYDKNREVKRTKQHSNKNSALKDSKGVLRYEIELSQQEIYRQSNNTRLVKKLLTKSFAHEILNKGLLELQRQSIVQLSDVRSSHQKIKKYGLNKRQEDCLIALLYNIEAYGEAFVKENESKSSFHRNITLLKTVLQKDASAPEQLLPLSLDDYSEIDFEEEIYWID
ncbi:hypothetical protein QWJ34_17115 [Saccharibacillus sp. CPCC 101409]|uniref:hypothetical protein n=1 Tax=Saccharibacillus sp. CPCC 101409 TaxID=3058041 RepID=UPI0026728F36|nr:hypothetical protein [Saccharibacillus sp. CPCC 101409]MDO3411489.1 hypothetical protein [Saccharibacillus sp. CPCC 101409]